MEKTTGKRNDLNEMVKGTILEGLLTIDENQYVKNLSKPKEGEIFLCDMNNLEKKFFALVCYHIDRAKNAKKDGNIELAEKELYIKDILMKIREKITGVSIQKVFSQKVKNKTLFNIIVREGFKFYAVEKPRCECSGFPFPEFSDIMPGIFGPGGSIILVRR